MKAMVDIQKRAFNRGMSKDAYNPISCMYVSDPKSTCVHGNMSRLSLTALLQRAAEIVPERLPSLTDCAVSEGTNYFSLECKLFFPCVVEGTNENMVFLKSGIKIQSELLVKQV